jgi:hypothetical protein
MAFKATFEGCRQRERAALRLPGRCMLGNRREHHCMTIDLAACGVAVECGDKGQIGDHIVAYIDQLGRMEGEIARQLQNGFAFKILAPPRKIEKLAARIAWLIQREVFGLPDARRQERVETDDRQIILTTPDCVEHRATLIDISSQGAASNVGIAPPIGSPVTVGRRRVASFGISPAASPLRFETFSAFRNALAIRNAAICKCCRSNSALTRVGVALRGLTMEIKLAALRKSGRARSTAPINPTAFCQCLCASRTDDAFRSEQPGNTRSAQTGSP